MTITIRDRQCCTTQRFVVRCTSISWTVYEIARNQNMSNSIIYGMEYDIITLLPVLLCMPKITLDEKVNK